MMKQVAVLGSQQFILGFQLAGLAAFELPREKPEATIRELMGNQDIGLIIIQEESLASLHEDFNDMVTNSIEPVVLTITEKDTNEEMRKLIKKSIGVDLWNKGE